MADLATYTRVECVHFRSLSSVCRAGVDVSTLRDADDRVPCIVIRSIAGIHPCAKRTFPSQPATSAAGQMTAMLASIMAAKCPKCGEQINGETEFNGAVLALPCRHVLRTAPGE